MAKDYYAAIDLAAELAPTLDNPTEFIRWAEDIVELLSKIYYVDYDDATTDLYEAVKEVQDYEDEDTED